MNSTFDPIPSPSTSSKRIRVIAGLGLAIALILGWVSWSKSRPAEYLASARAAVRLGDPTQALGWIDRASAHPSARDEAELLRAEILLEGNDIKGAAAALDKVNGEGTRKADFAFWKGRVLFKAGQPYLAEGYFKAALTLRPTDAEAARWLAAAAYEIGDRTQSVSALVTVAKLDPKDARARRTLGVIYQENEEYEDACAAFRESLSLDRAQPAVRLDLAECLIKVARLDEAAKELDECEGHVPEARRSELLAALHYQQGNQDAARKALDAGLKLEPDRPGLLLLQARVDLARAKAEPALAFINRAINAEPYRSESYYLRAQILKVLKRDEDSKLDFAKAAELSKSLQELSKLDNQAAQNPTDPEIRHKLGRLCEQLGKPELAESWYRAALACDPKYEAAATALRELRGRRGVRGR